MDLTPENFERLLAWLHPNPEEAGRAYEHIRTRLIKRFSSHGCSCPDELADKTIDRVAHKLTDEMVANWVGEKERYFHRVAFYVLLEYRAIRIEEVEMSDDFALPNLDGDDDLEPKFECLDNCLDELSSYKRDLIKAYYGWRRGEKIEKRKELAQKLNLELPVLRVQALRIRRELKICIVRCLHGDRGVLEA